MEIREAFSEEEFRTIYPVMRQLRTHLSESEYLSMVERMRGEGYRLAAAYDDGGKVVGAAGFRVQEFLYCGKLLYVDDLVTAEDARSTGVGAAMLRWLEDEARRGEADARSFTSIRASGERTRIVFISGRGWAFSRSTSRKSFA
ncbi:MAG: GNAT family N-acetyltransferase, partial [Rubrobacteraceae bacterium]